MMELSKTKQRKRLPRCDTASSNGTIRTKCSVCIEILRLLKSGEDKDRFSDLGNFEDVMISTQCDVHPRIGLGGLRDISEPRNYVQDVFKFEKGSSVITTKQQDEDQSPWSQRGWTFQEQIFARRHLVFIADKIRWECACGSFLEDLTSPPASELISQCTQSRDKAFSTSFPNFRGYANLVCQYNDREFMFPGDALDAFAGITSALSHDFYGGFICGLPALFLDAALIWQPEDTCERRISSKPSNPTEMGLPSWSWVGWKGKINTWTWNCDSEYIRIETLEEVSEPRTIPLLQWYSRSCNKMDLSALKEPLELEVLKRQGLQGLKIFPLAGGGLNIMVWRTLVPNTAV